jgi:hypothetical protein
MSFSEDDKEALGEDLDELKTELLQARVLLTNINTHVKTLTNIAVAFTLVSAIGFFSAALILILQ